MNAIYIILILTWAAVIWMGFYKRRLERENFKLSNRNHYQWLLLKQAAELMEPYHEDKEFAGVQRRIKSYLKDAV